MVQQEPTYTVHEIVDMIHLFERKEMSILVQLLNEEKKLYSLVDLQRLNMITSMRYGEIKAEENKK